MNNSNNNEKLEENIYYDDLKKTPLMYYHHNILNNKLITKSNYFKKSENVILSKISRNYMINNSFMDILIGISLEFSILFGIGILAHFNFSLFFIFLNITSLIILIQITDIFYQFKNRKRIKNLHQKIITKSHNRREKIINKFLEYNINVNDPENFKKISENIDLKYINNLNKLKNLPTIEQEEILKKIYINEFNKINNEFNNIINKKIPINEDTTKKSNKDKLKFDDINQKSLKNNLDWDTSKVKDMSNLFNLNMFEKCKSITYNNQANNGSIKPPKKIIKIND